MEAFSVLKYWRTTTASGGGSGVATTSVSTANARAATKTIVAAAAVSPYSSDGEDGPYFDLEFALPDHESDIEEEDLSAKSQENDPKSQETESEDETESDSEAEEISVHENDEEEELKVILTGNECTDQSVTLSPSDEQLFFKSDLVSIEPSSILLNGPEDQNCKFPVNLVKSATKFRVLLLKLKKSKSANGDNNLEKAEKSEKAEADVQVSSTPKIVERENIGKVDRKFLAVKFNVEEVPFVSLFTRDTSSKENNNGKCLKVNGEDSDTNAASDERKLTKEVVQKYLKMVKPFYVRVSKRYVEKLKFSGHLSFPGGGSKGCAAAQPLPEKGGEGVAEAEPSNVKSQLKQGNNNLQAGLKVVRKHLGKSRSASAAVAVAAPPPGKAASNRRDDSQLQVQDGIQGAIMHCKRSFNASRDVESSSILCRSVSDPSYEKSLLMPKTSRASSSSLSSSFSGEAKTR